MFNPFRKNSKVPDLTPTTWEKIRLRGYMAWVAVRVLSTRINMRGVVKTVLVIGAVAATVHGCRRFVQWGNEQDRAWNNHWQNDPCSAFANETANHVPLRCLPGSPVLDKR